MTRHRADGRKSRTRRAIITAFNQMVFEGRAPHEIRVSEIVQRSRVGRSTFYEHFSNATDVHLRAFSHPLSVLAQALVDHAADPALLTNLLDHFWTHRNRAEIWFAGAGRTRVLQLLLSLMADIESARSLSVYQRVVLADGALGLITCWLQGQVDADAGLLTHEICRLTCAIRSAR